MHPLAIVPELQAGITDEQLTDPTPCPRYTVADLLDHVGGLAAAFTAAATKTPMAAADPDAALAMPPTSTRPGGRRSRPPSTS